LSGIYEPIVVGRAVFISFQTVAELLYGARRADWGEARRRRLDDLIGRVEVIWPGPSLVNTYAQLRVDFERNGHALGQRVHDADRWIAATAVRLGVPSVTHDGIFRNAPGLAVKTALPQ
jgi:hypothetical protein